VLLLDGKNMLGAYEKYLDKKMKLRGAKNFICYTKDRKTVYMGNVSSITIYEMPNFIKQNFGCDGAINLDAGGSLGMIYNHKIIRKNSRPVMDAFVVVDQQLVEKQQKILEKYGKIIDKVVKKLHQIKHSSYQKYQKILTKLK
jgi:exopolysaccharide biosynthesis protein